MRFNSLTYWVFLSASAAIYAVIPRAARRAFLLAISLMFYASWQPSYVLLLVGFTAVNWFGANWIMQSDDRRRRGAAIVAVDVGFLAYFKYLGFVSDSINDIATVLRDADLFAAPSVLLPLGVSFYMFQSISYIVDVMRKREKQHPFLDFQVYIAFFPQLIAGPIMRAKEFMPQLDRQEGVKAEEFRSGIELIITGMFLKIVLADSLAGGVDEAFSKSAGSLSGIDVAVAAIGFGLQIYFDFAAYSRIAIGSAKLFGIDLVENFNWPYIARNPADFWARWHMSLSRWVRDYLFFPLTRGKATLSSMARAAFISMVIMGIWHGAGWTFILWGAYHGVALAIYHANGFARRKRLAGKARERPTHGLAYRTVAATASIGATFAMVTVGWIFFRADSVNQALTMMSRLVDPSALSGRSLGGTFYLLVALLLALTWIAPTAAKAIRGGQAWADAQGRPAITVPARLTEGALLGMVLSISLVLIQGDDVFIYFQF